jgi:hypothetical protein
MISAILNLNGAYGPYSILCLPYFSYSISYPTRVKSNVVYLDEYRLRIGFVESRATGH